MAVIEFENVSKGYRLGASRTSLREAIPNLSHKLFRRNGAKPDDQLFWALNDVSFKVEQGEVLGIIGHNGAGKSTILKLLSKVSFPTSGHIRTQGRMAALIELGAGFHPDLSGRENIYMNGSILGLKRREIDAAFSEIVEFAGLEKFIDTPVKRYSSGMYVRLAFAVASHVKAELLLVDEVLSVGDQAFQQKCLTKMEELRDSGATIIFISHNMWSVSNFCRRVLLLRKGQIVAEGKPDEIIEAYRRRERENLLSQDTSASTAPALQNAVLEQNQETAITKIELLRKDGQSSETFTADDHLLVRAHYFAPTRIEQPAFLIQIRRADGLICCSVAGRGDDILDIYKHGTFEAVIGPLQLVPDVYTVETHIVGSDQPIVYARSFRQTFNVEGYISSHAGVFTPAVEWLPQRVTA